MIHDIATYLPPTVVSNDRLAALYPGWSADKIFEKTGIRERRVVAPDECASDLAFRAAESLFERTDRSADFLLFCTQSPDYLLPTTACVLQHRLRLPISCAALDFNLGCSGYVYGLALADSLIRSGAARRVLLLTGDTYSRLIHPQDKSTRTIFGDAGTATLLTTEARPRLNGFVLGTDGAGAQQLMVQTGGARNPEKVPGVGSVDDSGNYIDSNSLYMNGPEIFNFTLQTVPKLVQSVCNRAAVQLRDIDLVLFHQANAFMLEHLRRKLQVPANRFVVDLEFCGNTVSSTIPLALERLVRSGRLQPKMKVLLAGFGVGYSWGGCILDW